MEGWVLGLETCFSLAAPGCPAPAGHLQHGPKSHPQALESVLWPHSWEGPGQFLVLQPLICGVVLSKLLASTML